MELVALFYLVDEFCKVFEPEWMRRLLVSGEARRIKPSSLLSSKVLTILIYFHQSNQKTFKGCYADCVSIYLRSAFSRLISYGRFVELMSSVIVLLHALLVHLFGMPTLANFIDSTTGAICDYHRNTTKQSLSWYCCAG
jgi:hypothetical protein